MADRCIVDQDQGTKKFEDVVRRGTDEEHGSSNSETDEKTPAHLTQPARAIPLHVHLKGDLEPELVLSLAKRNNIDLSPYFKNEDDLRSRYDNFTDLNSFLNVYYQCASVLCTERDFYDLTMSYFARAHRDKVVQAEMFFNPRHHKRSLSFETCAGGILSEEEDEDDIPPTSPMKSKGGNAEYANNDNIKKGSNTAIPTTTPPVATLHNHNNLIAIPSIVDNQQIDACLQDTMNRNANDNLNANLSFRESYDLEQVFSFIKEGPNGGQVSGYGPGDRILGNLRFNLVFSESRSDDEGDHRRQASGNTIHSERDKHNFLPTIHTLRWQSMELTPIDSFSEENKHRAAGEGSIVPLSSIDGMALRSFFSSSPTTINGKPASSSDNADAKVGGEEIKIGSPPMNGRHGPAMSLATNAPVIHVTPPSYSHHQPFSPDGGPYSRYHGPQGGPHRGMNQNYSASTPPHGPATYRHRPPSMNPPSSSGGGGMSMPFPNKRIKLSSRHSLHPMVDISKRSVNGDFFVLLREMAPCFGGFRFKLPEMESSANDPTATIDTTAAVSIVGNECSPQGPVHVSIAKRRISSSLCAFGGSLPLRTVSFDSSSPRSVTNDPNSPSNPNNNANNANMTLTESPQEQEERHHYKEQLSKRYFIKEHCISWDVELHEIIAPKMGLTKRGRGAMGKAAKLSTLSDHFKEVDDIMGGSKHCVLVTPQAPNTTPGDSPGSSSTPGAASSPREKGSKIKYRCKLCGQPKQNHTCTYQSSMVRSIGTMVYPAVNAFVSNEPGRLAPPLSEMNNFISVLSNDTSMGGGHLTSGGPPSHHPPPHHAPIHHNHHHGAPYNVLSPDTSHWSPNTPGGLSTIKSCDANSLGAPPPGCPPPSRKRDHNYLLMSRSMTRTMSHPPSPPPRPPAAPGGAIPNDVLFRDAMELKKEQYRTVRSITTTGNSTSTPANGRSDARHSPNAYRYPHIPTPNSHRKEMGDTLFALSREVPKLTDSCAAILSEAQENDLWDQAMAELTTQVLVVLKCEERDYTLEGLRRHLLTLGIAC